MKCGLFEGIVDTFKYLKEYGSEQKNSVCPLGTVILIKSLHPERLKYFDLLNVSSKQIKISALMKCIFRQ